LLHGPSFSALTHRLRGGRLDAWAVHGRAARRAAAGEDVILLSIGDPDFETPPPVVAAAFASIREGRTHYSPAAGERSLREAAARYHRRLSGQEVGANNVLVVPGAQCGLFCGILCVAGPGEEVLVPEPMYVTYETVIAASGATLVPVPLRPENDFHLDPSDLEAAVTPRTRAVLLNTPHNPTGAVLTAETLAAVGELAERRDLWVVSDEVYARMTFERPHVSAASTPAATERVVTVSSLSKSHAMTGWRIGWVVVPDALAPHVEMLLGCMLYGSPPFIQDAAVAALEESEASVEHMRAAYRRRRDLACERLARAPGLAIHRPEGGMFVMLDVRPTGLSGIEFADRLLDAERVSVLPGEGFGDNAAGHVRVSFAVELERLIEACTRIVRFCHRLAQSGALDSARR